MRALSAFGPGPAIVVTPSRVLALALPMTLSHITTPLLGLIGSAAIGRLGDAALLGAIALGAVVFDMLFWSFGGLRMATAGLTAQAVGSGRTAEPDLILARALALAAVVGVAMVALQTPIAAAAITLTGASPAVRGALRTYLAIRILAAPFTLANYAILGSTLGRGRSDLGLLLQVGINGANIGLTLALVIGAGLGVAGAAIATVGAEAAGVALGLVVLRRLDARPLAAGRGALADRSALKAMLVVNRDVMIRTVALLLAFAAFASLGARAGDETLAANAVLQNIFLIGSFFLDGFATAAEILCGQCLGAGQESGFRRAVRLALALSLAFGLAIAAAFWLVGPAFIDAVTTSVGVRAIARDYLPYAVLSPLVGAAAFAFDGVYVGATWSAAMRNVMLAAFAVYVGLLVVAQGAGNRGLWIALLAFLAVRGAGQALLYPRLARHSFMRLEPAGPRTG